MGIEETNILFDIWTGNASYAPIHHTMAEKYKPRDPKKHKVCHLDRIWYDYIVKSWKTHPEFFSEIFIFRVQFHFAGKLINEKS